MFVRYIANGKLEEELLMCVSLPGTCTGEDIFSAVGTRLHNHGLSWECCISICTDRCRVLIYMYDNIYHFIELFGSD